MCDRSQADKAPSVEDLIELFELWCSDDFDLNDFMSNSFRAEHGREPHNDDEFLRWSEAEVAKIEDALAQVQAEEAISRCTRH